MSLSDDTSGQSPGVLQPGVVTLIDELLAEQRRLTAVEKFSRLHDRHEESSLERRYRDLIPLTKPRPGEQYAFEVDLDRCSGCKGCVTACHSLNGLDDGESWREVGFLVGEAVVPLNAVKGGEANRFSSASIPGNKVIPLQQTVTSACHHCVEPGCLSGCPVLAYDKDPLTGIVRHLDDQCIGCSYCILKCPYDVPKYSAKLGIVRKCDMCHGRLAEGEAPACVQACPNQAIRITLVNPDAVRADARKTETSQEQRWLPDAPAPDYTIPTTKYLSSKNNRTLRAADHETPKPQPAHWPLLLMLVLTQAGIGGFLSVAAKSMFGIATVAAPLAAVSFGFLAAGLLASVFHLGRPQKAWRVWLGWRTSWLSREAIALNLFAGAATGALAALWAGKIATGYRLSESLTAMLRKVEAMPPWVWGVPLLCGGLAALFSQTMVYADTHRQFWRGGITGPKFFGSSIVLGVAIAAAFQPSPQLLASLMIASLLKLGVDIAVLKHADSDGTTWTQLRRTATLQRGPLRPVLSARILCGLFGGVFLPFAALAGVPAPHVTVFAAALCLAGELCERHLFFTSVAPDKMPGTP